MDLPVDRSTDHQLPQGVRAPLGAAQLLRQQRVPPLGVDDCDEALGELPQLPGIEHPGVGPDDGEGCVAQVVRQVLGQGRESGRADQGLLHRDRSAVDVLDERCGDRIRRGCGQRCSSADHPAGLGGGDMQQAGQPRAVRRRAGVGGPVAALRLGDQVQGPRPDAIGGRDQPDQQRVHLAVAQGPQCIASR